MNNNLLQQLLATDDIAEKASIVAEDFFEKLPREVALLARQCAILHWFDQSIIEALAKNNFTSPSQLTEAVDQIISLPFIEKLTWGLAFHSLTREGLIKRYALSQPRLLVDAASLAGPTYNSKETYGVIVAEAFYCYVIAGERQKAIELLDQLFEEAILREDWSYIDGLEHILKEAEQLPFVQPLTLTETHWITLGMAHRTLRQLETSIADYNKAIAINPTNYSTFMFLGASYFEALRYKEALSAYTRTIELNPTFVQSYINRGLIYVQQEKYEEAARDFNQAILIEPNNSEAHTYLNQLFQEQRLQPRQSIMESSLRASKSSAWINKVAKAKRYAEEPERIQFTRFEVKFRGDNDLHTTSYDDGEWHCTCRFFQDWGDCCHTMAMQRVLGVTIPQKHRREVPHGLDILNKKV